MSTPLAVSCPHCGAGLKLKNNQFVGKKVPCPKCKQPFLVEEPAEDEFLSQDDDFGAMDDMEEEEEVEAPRSKGKSKGDSKSAKGKGKKKSKSGGGLAPIAMIAGGVVLGIGILGGIVYGAMTLFSGGGSNSVVKWMPDEIDVMVQVRVADTLNAPIFKPIMDHPTLSKLMNQPPMGGGGQVNPATAFFQGLNIQAKDVDTLTVGIIDGIQSGAGSGFAGAPGTETPKRFVAVVKLKTAVDESKLASAPATVLAKEDYNGKSVYALAGSVSPKVLIHAVNPTTYLVGSDAELKGAIDGKGAAPASKRFDFVDTKSSIVFAAAPKDETKLKTLGITTLRKSPFGNQTVDATVQGIHGVSYQVTFGTDAIVSFRSSLNASMAQGTAEQGKKEIEEQRASVQAQMAQLNGAGFNPLMPTESLKKLLGHVDTMLGSAQATSSGTTATVTMTLSGKIVEDGLVMATPYMPMLTAMVAEQEKAAAAAQAAAAKSSFGSSPMDVTAYPGAVIDAGEKSKTKINNLNDQHQADLAAQMQEGGASNDPAKSMHASMTPNGNAATPPAAASGAGDPSAAMHASMAAGAGAVPAGNGNAAPAANDPAKAMHAATAPAPAGANPGNAAANDPSKAMHASMAAGAGAVPAGNGNAAPAANDPAKAMHAAAGAGNAAANGQNADKPAEKPASKSRSRRKP